MSDTDTNNQQHGKSILLKESNNKVGDVVTVAAHLAKAGVYPSASMAIAAMVRQSPRYIETAASLGLRAE